jgi:hypothetical protein
MTALTITLALLAGWCGTPYPRRWKFPFPPIPFPPEPDPCFVCGKILGALGGLAFNLGLHYLTSIEPNIETTLVGGYLGGIFLNDTAASLMDSFKTKN